MKAFAYYRTRPSEPEASDLALRLQREAVQRDAEQSGLEIVAEFIEREGEAGSETYPAYVAAVRAASAYGDSDDELDTGLTTFTMLYVATQAAIGMGELFQKPEVAIGGGNGAALRTYLEVPTIPVPPEIVLPAGAPGPQCLYAAYRPRQLHTLVYLCNAGTEALVEVSVATNNIDMGLFFEARRGEEPWAGGLTGEQRRDVVPPGACVLIGSLSHVIRDRVARHRLAYTDAAGQRWTAEANDLDAAYPTQDGDQVWVALSPARGPSREAR